MTKSSFKKLSFLGLVLLAASAVTAAIMPDKKNTNKFDQPGSLTASDDNGNFLSCTPTDAVGDECNDTDSRIGANGLSGSTAAANNQSRSNFTTVPD